jgi:Tfp pilus assembly protein PilF
MRLNVVLICAGSLAGSAAYAWEPCGDLANAYGPYDYRVNKAEIKAVESAHFNTTVERLQGGVSGYLGGDLDYTLRAVPNHHRALLAMDRYAQRLGTNKVPNANFTIDCYYDRAVRFRPDDGTVRMLYGSFLGRNGKPQQAIAQLQEAEKILGDNPNLHYNMGLVYLDLKDYDKALTHAHRAYQLGFNLPGLRQRLQKAGKWREPQPAESSQAGSPAPAAARAQDSTEAPKVESSATGASPSGNP